MKRKPDLARLLNLDWTAQTNTTTASGQLDLPMLSCHTSVFPEFLALYSEPSRYQEAGSRTGICFYLYDKEFDGIHGLFNAIYYHDERLLNYYRRRFTGIHLFIAPDYSQFGDIHSVDNLHRLFKAALVSLWLTNELHAVVIPNITGGDEHTLAHLLASLRDCSVVAFSTKGHMRDQEEKRRLERMIRMTVDTLELDAIVVYDCCGDDTAALELFSYAAQRGISIVIPDNTLKRRNRQRKAAA